MSAQSLGLTLSGKSGRSILFRDFLLMVPISMYTLTCCICAKAQTPQQYVYAGVPLVPAASEIATFSKESITGALSPISGSPTVDKLEGGSMTVDALGRFLFVLDATTSKISMFRIDRSTGALTEVPASPFSAGPTENPGLAPASPISIAAEASGQFLYVGYMFGNFLGQSAIDAFLIDATNLQLVPLPVQPTTDIDSPPIGLIADPKGRYLYAGTGPNLVTNTQSATTNVYKIDSLTGHLNLNGYAGDAQHYGRSIALDRRGRFFFEAWGTSTGSINSASISPVDGTALSGISILNLQPADELPVALLTESAGKFLYVQQTSGVATYSINQTTGALTLSQPPSSLFQFANGKAVTDPLGPYLYALQNDGVRGFQIDPLAGALTPLPGSPFSVGAAGGRGLAISGSAVQAISGPVAILFPASKSFGTVTVSQSSNSIVLNISNTGDQALIINSIALTGPNAGDFTATPNCPVSLVGGASCSVSLVFSPSAIGPRLATLSFADNAPGSPQLAQLSGTGDASQPGVTLAPGTLSFAAVDQGSSSTPQPITLSNSGAAALHITSVALSGANIGDFLISSNGCNGTIVAGANCMISVVFAPLGNGLRSASITISDDAPGAPHSVQLTGSGTGAPVTRPGISIAPNSISFPTTTQGTSSLPQTVTLTSAGSAPLHLSSISLTGANSSDFMLTNGCATQAYAVSASCNLSVTFTPSSIAVGARLASLVIADDAAGSPQIVVITGVAPDPITAPGSVLTFSGTLVQVVKAGQTASYNLQLMPGFTGTLTFQCAGAPLAATCLVPPSMSVTSGTKLPLTVTISTTGAAAELIPRQPLHWLPSFFQVGRVLCLLFALFAAVYATGRCDRDGVVRVLSPAATLAACLLVVALPLTGCGGAAATAQSTPVTQSLTTPSGTSKIVLQPSAAAANGKPVGTIVPIELTLTVQ